MTREQWFKSVAIFDMLEFSKISERKSRLFACSCVRRLWHLLSDDQKQAIEFAELVADGKKNINEKHLNRTKPIVYSISYYIHEACWLASHDGLVLNYASAHCCTNVGRALMCGNGLLSRQTEETKWQANLLRHMVKPYD
jgi:hypothetical protein